jgi:hypothetical protein
MATAQTTALFTALIIALVTFISIKFFDMTKARITLLSIGCIIAVMIVISMQFLTFILYEWIIISLAIIEISDTALMTLSTKISSTIDNAPPANDQSNIGYVQMLNPFLQHYRENKNTIFICIIAIILMAILSRSFMISVSIICFSIIIYIFALPASNDKKLNILNYDTNFRLLRAGIMLFLMISIHLIFNDTFTRLASMPLYSQFFAMDQNTIYASICLIIALSTLVNKWMNFFQAPIIIKTQESYSQIIQFDIISSIFLIGFGGFLVSYTIIDAYYPLQLILSNHNKTEILYAGIMSSEQYNDTNEKTCYGIRLSNKDNTFNSRLLIPPFKVVQGENGVSVYYRHSWQEKNVIKPTIIVSNV